MTPSEFSVLIKAMQALFPAARICPDDESKTVWFRVLGDLDYTRAAAAIQKHACTSRFPPSIAEIREQCLSVTGPERKDWIEGWSMVEKTIHDTGMHRPREALEKLRSFDPTTARVAEMLGWKNLCISENSVADRASFRQCYETIQSRESQAAKLPPSVSAVIARLSANMGACENALPEGEKR